VRHILSAFKSTNNQEVLKKLSSAFKGDVTNLWEHRHQQCRFAALQFENQQYAEAEQAKQRKQQLPSIPVTASPLNPPTRQPLVPLFVATEWDTTKGGISSFNMQLVQDVATKLNEEEKTEIYVLIVQDDKNTTDEQIKEAKNAGITLLFPVRYRGTIVGVNPYCHQVSVIVGHAHVTGTDAKDLLSIPQFSSCKLVLFNHVIPALVDPLKLVGYDYKRMVWKESMLLDLAQHSDAIFSVGDYIHEHFDRKFDQQKSEIHKIFYPPPNPYFQQSHRRASNNGRIYSILLFARIEDDTFISKGVDIAAAACVVLMKLLKKTNTVSPQLTLRIRGVSGKVPEHKQKLESKYSTPGLAFDLREFGSQEEIRDDLQSCNVCLMTSRLEPFGLVGLEAIASETTVLVTRNSGLAYFMSKYLGAEGKQRTVETDAAVDNLKTATKWADKMIRCLCEDQTATNKLLAQNLFHLFDLSNTKRFAPVEDFIKTCQQLLVQQK